jgi:hypothetical protein
MIRHAAALVLAVHCAPALAADEATYIGRWATDAADCGPEDVELEMTEAKLGMPDMECAMSGIVAGEGIWHAKLTCEGEGAPALDAITIRATANRLTLQFQSSGGQLFQFVRCP